MAKNSHSKGGYSGWNAPMTFAMKLLLAGCIAEFYLMLIRRFYIEGTLRQVVAWSRLLPGVALAGLAAAIIGFVLIVTRKAQEKTRKAAGWAAGCGAFFALSSLLVIWKMSSLSFLLVLVPMLMVLVVLWSLYDRNCATALSILALSLTTLWVIRRTAASFSLALYGKIAAAVYLVAVIAYALYVHKVSKAARSAPAVKAGSQKKWRLWDAKCAPLPVYIACALSVAAVGVSLLGGAAVMYATWGLTAVVFVLAVYYTVKQL